jgi:hypothetical protein
MCKKWRNFNERILMDGLERAIVSGLKSWEAQEKERDHHEPDTNRSICRCRDRPVGSERYGQTDRHHWRYQLA